MFGDVFLNLLTFIVSLASIYEVGYKRIIALPFYLTALITNPVKEVSFSSSVTFYLYLSILIWFFLSTIYLITTGDRKTGANGSFAVTLGKLRKNNTNSEIKKIEVNDNQLKNDTVSVQDNYQKQKGKEDTIKPTFSLIKRFSEFFYESGFQAYVASGLILLIGVFFFQIFGLIIGITPIYMLAYVCWICFLVLPFVFALWVDYKKHEHHIVYLLVKWVLLHIFIQAIVQIIILKLGIGATQLR